MFNYFDYFNKGFIFGATTDKYKPYINYTWSNTFQVADKMYSKNTGNSGQDLQLFSGQGCWFNGIDMQITVPVNATIQTEIKRVNGVVGINTNTQNLTNYNVYSGSGAKVYKDLYLFNRALVSTEIEKYNNQPNQFFMDSLEDNSCILAMPMCEKNNLVKNYKNNTNYPINNYLATCRTNAQRLSYGLQTSGFKRDSLGKILSKSNFLEADEVGYGNTGWIPEDGQEFTIEWIFSSVISTVATALMGIGIESNNNADLYLRQSTFNGTVHVKIGSNTVNITNVTESVVFITASVTSESIKVYKSGVFISSVANTYNRSLNTANRAFYLNGINRGNLEKIMSKETRLFKVHTKALTQEEVTKNFNKYQSQGLLNE